MVRRGEQERFESPQLHQENLDTLYVNENNGIAFSTRRVRTLFRTRSAYPAAKNFCRCKANAVPPTQPREILSKSAIQRSEVESETELRRRFAPTIAREPRPIRGRRFSAFSVTIGFATARPDERVTVAALVAEEVGVDRRGANWIFPIRKGSMTAGV